MRGRGFGIAIGSVFFGMLVFACVEYRQRAVLADTLHAAQAEVTATRARLSFCEREAGRSIARTFAALSAHPAALGTAAQSNASTGSGALDTDEQAALAGAADQFKLSAKQKLDELEATVHLDAGQSRALRRSLDDMNTKVAKSMDALTAIMSNTGKAPTADDLVKSVGAGIASVVDAEKAFRAGLDRRQLEELGDTPLDFAQQIATPTLMLFGRAIVLSASIAHAADTPPTPGEGDDVPPAPALTDAAAPDTTP